LSHSLCVGRRQRRSRQEIFRIGFLDDSTASSIAVRLETFRQELSKLGWIEGKNVAIEYRFAEGKLERLPELTANLVRLKVDLIVAQGTPGVLAAKSATIGPVIVFGPLVSWIVRALEGAVMVRGLSALGAGLHSIGIPKYSIMEYEKALISDKFIVIAHGKPDDLAKAKSILETPCAAQISHRHREVRN